MVFNVWTGADLLCEEVTLQLVSETFLLRNTFVVAVVLLRHGRDEVQALWLHLEAGTPLASVFPGVDSVVGVNGTGQVEGDTLGDRVSGPCPRRSCRICFSSGAVQLLY